MIKHAIIGTDFSSAVSEIIKNSGMFKTIGIEKITLIHVRNLRDIVTIERASLELLLEKLEKQKKQLAEKGFNTNAELVYGIPHIQLEFKRKETGAGLIIIGSHGRTPSMSTIGGTISNMLQNIKAPVLVIPLNKKEAEEPDLKGKTFLEYEQIFRKLENYEPEWELKCGNLNNHVLFATDFSDFSEAAFQWLKNQNIKLNKLTLLHVQDKIKIGKYLENKLEEFNQIDTERLTRLKHSFNMASAGTDIDIEIKYGKPIEEILNFIKENNVSLTVMGSQGRGYFAEIFIGSVSHQVARNSISNVLIIPVNQDLR